MTLTLREIALVVVFVVWYLSALIGNWDDNYTWHNAFYAIVQPIVLPTIVCGILYILFF